MELKYFITEYPKGHGETEYRTGDDDGYVNLSLAMQRAEILAKETGHLHSVDSCHVDTAGGDRMHAETIAYTDGTQLICDRSMSDSPNDRSAAYHTGYEAHYQGEPRSANPYAAGTFDAREWFAGWDDSQQGV